MLGPDNLAGLSIKRVIFHDVPRNIKGQDKRPILSDIPTPLDADRTQHLKDRMIRALGSRSAYAITFNSQSPSPVPDLIRKHTSRSQTEAQFVNTSQTMANYLFEQQVGASSAGLLAVLDARIGTQTAIAILKLEREEGAQLEPSVQGKKKTFAMSVLDNLVLTGGTKLFKNALFLRTGPDDDDFNALACDNQRGFATSVAMAQFWQKFLGCKLREEPRITTQKFFDATLAYINEQIKDPVQLNNVYEHLLSELKAPRGTLAPRTFIEDYIPARHRQPLEDYLRERHVSLQQFTVDNREIARRLKRRMYHTSKGATITVPADDIDLEVQIGDDQITIVDAVDRVDTK